jgi:hypothetical protein
LRRITRRSGKKRVKGFGLNNPRDFFFDSLGRGGQRRAFLVRSAMLARDMILGRILNYNKPSFSKRRKRMIQHHTAAHAFD